VIFSLDRYGMTFFLDRYGVTLSHINHSGRSFFIDKKTTTWYFGDRKHNNCYVFYRTLERKEEKTVETI